MKKKLSKTAQIVLNEINLSPEPITFENLIHNLTLESATIRYAIRILTHAGKIKRVPNLTDLRSCYYQIEISG